MVAIAICDVGMPKGRAGLMFTVLRAGKKHRFLITPEALEKLSGKPAPSYLLCVERFEPAWPAIERMVRKVLDWGQRPDFEAGEYTLLQESDFSASAAAPNS